MRPDGTDTDNPGKGRREGRPTGPVVPGRRHHHGAERAGSPNRSRQDVHAFHGVPTEGQVDDIDDPGQRMDPSCDRHLVPLPVARQHLLNGDRTSGGDEIDEPGDEGAVAGGRIEVKVAVGIRLLPVRLCWCERVGGGGSEPVASHARVEHGDAASRLLPAGSGWLRAMRTASTAALCYTLG